MRPDRSAGRSSPLLNAAGHQVTAASRETGVDAAIGSGLDSALHGADVVIDVLNSPTMEDDAALAFFTATSSNLTVAAKNAGVQHYVLLSIVGVDGLQGGGYLRGKVVQENTVAASGLPYTIVRATQFHELTGQIAGSLIVGDEVHAPDALHPTDRLGRGTCRARPDRHRTARGRCA